MKSWQISFGDGKKINGKKIFTFIFMTGTTRDAVQADDVIISRSE